MKSTEVDESLSTTSATVLFQRKSTYFKKQFLLLKVVPIQDWSQQLSIHKIFTLHILHGNFAAWYDINTQYLRITQDETMAVEISPWQFGICQEVTGQFL